MSDHDESLLDKAKNAFGMGSRDERHADRARGQGRFEADQTGEATDAELDDQTPGADGATQASGTTGATGGTGATAALGGAGSGGAAGATPPTSGTEDPAPADRVRTEYEMGHEIEPEHETRAESGTYRGGTFGESPPGSEVDRNPDTDAEAR